VRILDRTALLPLHSVHLPLHQLPDGTIRAGDNCTADSGGDCWRGMIYYSGFTLSAYFLPCSVVTGLSGHCSRYSLTHDDLPLSGQNGAAPVDKGEW